MTDLPAGVPLATFTGWFSQAVGDGFDTNRDPDMGPMAGTITFVPDVEWITLADALPQPMTLFPRPIVCRLDEEGYLLGTDLTRDLSVIATGTLIPSYTVTFDFVGVPAFTKKVLAPAGSRIDLPLAIEVPVSGSPGGVTLRTDELVIPQGTTWEVRWPILNADGSNADLTGWGVRAQARVAPGAGEVLHEWNAAAGNASVIGSSVSIRMSPDISSALTWSAAVFDVELFNLTDGRVTRVSQGVIRIDTEVTR